MVGSGDIAKDLLAQLEKLRFDIDSAETVRDVKEAFRNLDLPTSIDEARSPERRLTDLERLTGRLGNIRGVGVVVKNSEAGILIALPDEPQAGQLLFPRPADPDSPDTLGAGAEGSESASTDTWTFAGTTGLEIWVVCRVVYNHAGDKKLYAYARKLTFDRYGRLYTVTGETRIEVDAAGAC